VHYVRKYRVRLVEVSSVKLDQLSQHFDTSAADVIRQLIVQARHEDFPES
jgi:hypothetical protein